MIVLRWQQGRVTAIVSKPLADRDGESAPHHVAAESQRIDRVDGRLRSDRAQHRPPPMPENTRARRRSAESQQLQPLNARNQPQAPAAARGLLDLDPEYTL